MRWSILALVVGCGRIDFDAGSDARDTVDASMACPPGYLLVVGSPPLGTEDFCVMLTEARAWIDANSDSALDSDEIDFDGCETPACDTDWTVTALPVSTLPTSAQPFRSVSAAVAQGACRSLGAGFDLMANREWMTIARRAELIGDNWAGGTPGSGRLVEGNTDSGSAGITDPANGYTDTGNDASQLPDVGWEQRRTLVIAPGVEVWDLPGNVQEWVDWTAGGALDGVPSPCPNGELPGYACTGLVADDFQSTTGTYDSSRGAGLVVGGAGNAVRRGGQTGDRSIGNAGIYGFNTNRNRTDIFGATGFRCVFRP